MMEFFAKIIQRKIFDKILNTFLKHVGCVVEHARKFKMFEIFERF